jgi:hypothetical protein
VIIATQRFKEAGAERKHIANDKLYVFFRSPIRLDDPSTPTCSSPCLLGEFDTGSGDVACIESELTSITWYYTPLSGVPPPGLVHGTFSVL